MINVLIWGIGGKMGKTVLECLQNETDICAVGGIDKFADTKAFSVPVFRNANEINVKANVIIDFSRPDAVSEMLEYAMANKLAVVIATTGYSPEQLDYISKCAESIAIFKTSNLSLGINLMTALCRKAVNFLGDNYDVEIIEQHHNLKVDSPSGTAISIANAINDEFGNTKDYVFGRHSANQKRTQKEIGIHSVRGGTIVGKHEAMFIGKDEIISISHEAQSKAVFASGAVRAAKFVINYAVGLHSMEELVKSILE